MNTLKRIIWLVLLVLLSACASSQLREYNAWVHDARMLAENGAIKWSDYYKGCFSRLADLPSPQDGKFVELEYFNTMIGYSLDYEKGQLNKSEFDEKRRLAQITRSKRMELRMRTGSGDDGAIHLQTTY